MAEEEKELENRLMEVGAILGKSPPSDVEGLLDLLNQTESFLSKVEQSPSASMSTALRPATNALVAKELLEHSDLDVKVAVASCISEITRITAPDAPYDDDLMKVVFQRIVEAFEKLDDMSSRSYSKRVSILETVAKVRSCVVMLDLECDGLILEMFNHLLRAIRTAHPENVLSSMETIMALVLDESEEISSDLLSCLLSYVKKDNMDVSPIAQKLVERVISKCARKLKPSFMELVQMMGTSLSQYNKIVASVCHGSSEDLEHSDLNASGEDLAADSKLSDRTVSDELPQGSEMLEPGVCPEEVGSKSPKSAVSNGALKMGNGDPPVEATSSEQKVEHSCRSSQSKEASATVGTEGGNSELVAGKVDAVQNTKRIRGRKTSKNHEKDVDPSGKEALTPSQTEVKDELQVPVGSENGSAQVVSPTANENLAEETRHRRGRPPGSRTRKSGGNSKVDHSVHRSQSKVESENDHMSEADDKSDSEGKPLRRSSKKIHAHITDSETPEVIGSGSGAKHPRQTSERESTKKVPAKESSRKQKSSNIKQQKNKNVLEKDEVKEMSLKEMSMKALRKDNSNLDEGMNSKSRRKRVRGTEEISESSQSQKEYGEELVGSKIKVWWPQDKKFYGGIVESFDPARKKHKVAYFDGDFEELVIKKERWEFLEGETATVRGQAKDSSSPDSAKVPRSKKVRTSSDSVPREAKETPVKSGGSSRSKSRGRDSCRRSRSAGDTPRPRGRPKGSGSKVPTPRSSKLKGEPGRNSKDDTTQMDSPPIKSSSREDSPKTNSPSINDTLDSDNKQKEDSAGTISKSKNEAPATGGPPKAGRKSKGRSTPMSVDKANTNGASAKGNLKVEESDATAANDPESEVTTGKKRRRKGHS